MSSPSFNYRVKLSSVRACYTKSHRGLHFYRGAEGERERGSEGMKNGWVLGSWLLCPPFVAVVIDVLPCGAS